MWRVEPALDQVRRSLRVRVGDGRLPPLATTNPLQTNDIHQPFDCAAGHLDALAVELQPDLAGSVDAVVLTVHPGDLDLQILIAQRPPARRPRRGVVVGGRGDRAPVLAQHAADRRDPEAALMAVDEPHENRCGRSVKVGLRRGAGRVTGPFPQTASRTRRAPFNAPGSPQAPFEFRVVPDPVLGQGVGMIEPR
jgi:hypothetical protein